MLRERPDPASRWKRFAALCLGVALWLVAVIGLFIPVFPSTPFWVSGAVFLAIGSEKFRCLINRLERRLSHPRRLKLRRVLRKIPGKAIKKQLGPTTQEVPIVPR